MSQEHARPSTLAESSTSPREVPQDAQEPLAQPVQEVRRKVRPLLDTSKPIAQLLAICAKVTTNDIAIPIEFSAEDEEDLIKAPFTRRAKDLRAKRKFEESIALLQRGYAKYPNNKRIVNSFGRTAIILGRPDIAEKFFRHALGFFLNDVYCIGSLADCLIRLHRTAEAQELIERGLAIEPGNQFLLDCQDFIRTSRQPRSPAPPRSSE